jgi:hypothetical protein
LELPKIENVLLKVKGVENVLLKVKGAKKAARWHLHLGTHYLRQ